MIVTKKIGKQQFTNLLVLTLFLSSCSEDTEKTSVDPFGAGSTEDSSSKTRMFEAHGLVSPPPKVGSAKSEFFGNSDSGSRIAFVLDFSGSMKEEGRVELLRSELSKSLKSLDPTVIYSIILFEELARFHDWSSRIPQTGNSHWHQATPGNLSQSTRIVSSTKPDGGTDWFVGLSAALDLNPKPEVIYFMTDGVSDEDVNEAIRKTTEKNNESFPTARIHTTALIKPDLGELMKRLAHENDGNFTIVDRLGNAKTSGP